MKKKIELKHHKDFHSIQFQNFNIKERNLIFALCYKLMEQETNLLEFNVKEIAKISNYTPTKAGDNIYKSLEKMYERIKNVSIVIKKENGVKHFVLFTVFETFEDKGLVQIKVNEEYRYLLNQVAKPFTIQNILDYTNLSSGYSQLMYSLLKKWEKSKNIEFEIKDFRQLLGIPTGYRISEIDKFVLTPILKELPKYFFDLKLEKRKTGKSVTSLKFSWGRKQEKINPGEVVEIKISENLNKAILKSKNNIYINKFLEDIHIKELIEVFTEKQLIEGLEYARKKIKEEFKKLIYLENSIRKGIENQKIKIVTIPNEPVQNIENEEKMEFEQTKTRITKKEYNLLYIQHLKKMNTGDNKFIKLAFDSANKNKFEILEEVREKEMLEISKK